MLSLRILFGFCAPFLTAAAVGTVAGAMVGSIAVGCLVSAVVIVAIMWHRHYRHTGWG